MIISFLLNFENDESGLVKGVKNLYNYKYPFSSSYDDKTHTSDVDTHVEYGLALP